MRASNPTGTADAEIAVGDFLRCTGDGWEGQVIDLDETSERVTLLIGDGRKRAVDPATLVFNWWDPKVL